MAVGRRWAIGMFKASRTSFVRRCAAMVPPHDSTTPGVEQDGEEEESRPGRDVGDVRDHT